MLSLRPRSGPVQAQIKQALHGQVRVLADSGRVGALRPKHPELPSQLVLARGRPVRIQQVPLIEHRVSHGTNSVEAIWPEWGAGSEPAGVDAHCLLTRSALSSRSTTESQLVRPCSAL